MSIKCSAIVWEQSSAKGSELLVLLALADHADEYGVAWPSTATLARLARVSERIIPLWLRRLEERGELITYRRPGRSNVYLVTLGQSEDMLKRARARIAELFRIPIPDAPETTTPDRPITPDPEITPEMDTPLIARSDDRAITPDLQITPTPDLQITPPLICRSPDPSLNHQYDPTPTANAVGGYAPHTGPDGPVAAPAQPPPPTASEKPPTPQQLLFSAICEAFGYDSKTLTRELRGAINRAVKSLHEVGARPEDIAPLHAFCAQRFTDFGPAALAKWWAEFVKVRPAPAPAPAPAGEAEHIEAFVDTSELELPRLLERAERKRQELLRAQQALEEAKRT